MDTEKTNFTEYNDEECWILLKGGCKQSLATLYFRYYDKLYDYAVSFCGDRELAEDQLQSLFLKIWERRHSLPNVEYVKTYLWVSLRRSLIDEKRRSFKIEANSNLLVLNDFRIVSSPEEIQLHEEHHQEVLFKLYQAMEQLHPRQKEILYLKFFEGMSYKEIEKITSLRYQSIRNYTCEAVKSLKVILSQNTNQQTEMNKMGLLKICVLIFSLFPFL